MNTSLLAAVAIVFFALALAVSGPFAAFCCLAFGACCYMLADEEGDTDSRDGEGA